MTIRKGDKMEKRELFNEEAQLADILRKEILKGSETIITPGKRELIDFEYVSKQPQPYISPIMTMSQDEILDFVEEFEVEELATLSVAELNRIGEVLGVEPEILIKRNEEQL